MGIQTTKGQTADIIKRLKSPNRLRDEKVWTYLVAWLFSESEVKTDLIQLFCSEPMSEPSNTEIWFEAQPLSPRKGRKGATERNSRIDLALGDIQKRDRTGNGIAFGPRRMGSWVCFIEAKCLSDCSTATTYDPRRNQLARVIESLLYFHGTHGFPERLIFTLLTPRLFKETPGTRLFWYKMQEYENRDKLLSDIQMCNIKKRDIKDIECPPITDRVHSQVLKLNWITYEDILGRYFGEHIDIVNFPLQVQGLDEKLDEILDAIQTGS